MGNASGSPHASPREEPGRQALSPRARGLGLPGVATLGNLGRHLSPTSPKPGVGLSSEADRPRMQSTAELGKELLRRATLSIDEEEIDEPQIEDALLQFQCADCSETTGITWVSMDYGVVVCALCAGVHRGLGTTTVRSLRLDGWSEKQVASVLEKGGNDAINAELEYSVPLDVRKPSPGSSGEERRKYIKNKYVDRLFAREKGGVKQGPVFDLAGSNQSRFQNKRFPSFVDGKREFVGIVSVAWISTAEVLRPTFRSRHLSGGYWFLATCNNGTFKAKSTSSVHADFKGTPPVKLSWDGTSSPLVISLFLGTKRLGCSPGIDLGFFLTSKNTSQDMLVDFFSMHKHRHVARFYFQLSFIDLR